jgi:hypothetical protein
MLFLLSYRSCESVRMQLTSRLRVDDVQDMSAKCDRSYRYVTTGSDCDHHGPEV